MRATKVFVLKEGVISVMILVSLGVCAIEERQCSTGMKTLGYTDPKGDIAIEHGNPLDITCVLTDKFAKSRAVNGTHNLYFLLNNETLDDSFVEVLNSSAVRLHISKPTNQSSMITCKSHDPPGPVCLNQVTVGTKPLKVTDFHCIGYNYENLTCTWTKPQNYIKTNYTLKNYFQGRAGRIPNKCAVEINENSIGGCFWNITTDPQYRQAQGTHYFILTAQNRFGTEQFNYTFSHFKNVLSGPPENLTKVNATTESILLSWSPPSSMFMFPPGLQYRVIYQSEYSPSKQWEFGGFFNNVSDRVVLFNLTGLQYAHALYDIRVAIRSNAADPDDEPMWSRNATTVIRTDSKIPEYPPRTDIGSFELVPSKDNISEFRNVYVYWQQISEYYKNGEGFNYTVTVEGDESLQPVEVSDAYAKFTGLCSDKNYTFNIWSRNKRGLSENKSTAFVPAKSIHPRAPSFSLVAYSTSTYGLIWAAPQSYRPDEPPITNYTIFWCTHDRDRPFQCKGHLNWEVVPNNVTDFNKTVPADKIHQFAIAANSATGSSGMKWADCTVIYDKSVSRMKNLNTSGPPGSTYIEVQWKLECGDRIGSIEGFIVYYCPIPGPGLQYCKGNESTITFPGNANSGNITNLTPYTIYMISAAYITKHKSVSQPSDKIFSTTAEDAPSTPPLNVSVTAVTNSSVTISWQPPAIMNGHLKYYILQFNNKQLEIGNEEPTTYTLTNLTSFINYTILLKACTVTCSAASEPKAVVTEVGYPSKIRQPQVAFQNESCTLVAWEKPVNPRGNTDFYEVQFKEKGQFENRTVPIFNLSQPQYLVESCGDDGKYSSFYISVRAVNIADGKRYEGPWSDELEASCRAAPNLLLIFLVPTCVLIAMGLFYLAKRMYMHCQTMRDVEVKLPPGLTSGIITDSSSPWVDMKIQDEASSRSSPADEELLLEKLGNQHLSGDSSGCSSGHESVTSSINSNTHLSSTSDSGTEQPRSDSTEDLHTTYSLRLRNVRPCTTSKGYVTMPSNEISTLPWSSKTPPGNYCVIGVDPNPITEVNPSYVTVAESDPEIKPAFSLLGGSTTLQIKACTPGEYVPLSGSEPAYVMAGQNIALQDDKSGYVHVADISTISAKSGADPHIWHQPIEAATALKSGYMSIGDVPSTTPKLTSSGATSGYIPHRHFDVKSLKED